MYIEESTHDARRDVCCTEAATRHSLLTDIKDKSTTQRITRTTTTITSLNNTGM